ncbi:MAG: hypothetical protein U1C74_12415 [Phenylobacterium sp.]|nr:hypothetical protein [Phenylobacterium sp.]
MSAERRQLECMREVAFALGMGFGEAATAEGDLDRKLQLFDAFHRSFASVRLSIALAMRLQREAQAPLRFAAGPAGPDAERPETLEAPERLEAPDRPEGPDPLDRPERYDERDRDRESEPARLPVLLRTLERVADDAHALTPRAAELPTLRELLEQVRPRSAPPPTPASPPSATTGSGALRARLSGGTATLVLPPRSGLRGLPGIPAPPPRDATGPPPRR